MGSLCVETTMVEQCSTFSNRRPDLSHSGEQYG